MPDITTEFAERVIAKHPQVKDWLSQPITMANSITLLVFVHQSLAGMTPCTLGILAFSGPAHANANATEHKTSLYAVHRHRPYLREDAGGAELMINIAATAVAARVIDLVQAELTQEELAQ